MVYEIIYQALKDAKIDKDKKIVIIEKEKRKEILPEILILKNIDKNFKDILQRLFENKNFNDDIKVNLDDFLVFLTMLKQRIESENV